MKSTWSKNEDHMKISLVLDMCVSGYVIQNHEHAF